MPTLLSLIFLIGFVAAIYFAVKAVRKAKQAEQWPVAPGRILPSEVSHSVSRDRDGTSVTWKPHVFYEYDVEGSKFKSDRLTGISFYSSNRRAAYRTVHNYPVGKEVDAYYNPEDPSDSMLEPGITTGGVVLIVVLIAFFGLAGVLLMSAQNAERASAPIGMTHPGVHDAVQGGPSLGQSADPVTTGRRR